MSDKQHISVEIYDQAYHLRGQDPAYIQKLADLVDAKMRAVAAHGTTVDSLRVAVLAALNVADELLTLEQRYRTLAGQVEMHQNALRTRAHSLNGLLDEVLDSASAGDAELHHGSLVGERRTG